MSLVLVRICQISLFLGMALAGFAQDYPQWRGPHRDGAASDFVAPKNWPEKLTRRWTVEVYRCRQRDLGTACHFRQSNLCQRHNNACFVDI